MDTSYKYGVLFGGELVADSEKARVQKEIQKVGSLTFTIALSESGWSAQCKEIPSIIAGNTNPTPTNIEIESEIRSAIFATFDVKVDRPNVESPYQNSFKYSAS